ncbi:MAG: hypothetical protein JWM12_3093 [Ilumatobacteraceae bacterium]|jgi:hypothetical protein|nr:hypothetical protein [Ilumatobacteraceae bacterium]
MSRMSKTSPADLAITFRSVPRRLREALGDDQPPAGTELQDQLARASALLGTPADATAIADAIARTPPDEWDPATLDMLRDVALEVGRHLRELAARHRHEDD